MIEAFTTPWGTRLEVHRQLDSTSRRAWQLGEAGADAGCVVVADRQTGGRGRRGRTWHSPAGLNLYFSLLLRPDLALDVVPALALAAGAALCRSLDLYHLKPRIKWPNDVFANERKLAGILAELKPAGQGVDFVVIGIGINVNAGPDSFPLELRGAATSLKIETGREHSRSALLERVLKNLHTMLPQCGSGGLGSGLKDYIEERFFLAGRRVAIVSGKQKVYCRPQGIDTLGRLQVQDDGGCTQFFSAGEAQLLKKEM